MFKFKSQYEELNLELDAVGTRVSADDHEAFGQNYSADQDDSYSIHCENTAD